MQLIQFQTPQNQNAVGICLGGKVQFIKEVDSVYSLFHLAKKEHTNIQLAAEALAADQYYDYETLLDEQRIRVPLDHPDPYHTWITGTGLTHLGSASSRNAMHQINNVEENMTDSMKMFRMGVENGKMIDEKPGVQPEWFYKGNGLVSVPSGQNITSPSFALEGSEEPEIAALYIIDKSGEPKRIGFALGNEFSDHKTEKINYLYLAHSKLRQCSYGPTILLGDLPSSISGESRIKRNQEVIWEKEFLTGEDHMSHNLANLEYHHFKYDLFRQPGDVHVHFLGTSALSFSEQVGIKQGDVFEIEAEPFQQALVNVFSK